MPDDLKVMLETAVRASSPWLHRKVDESDIEASRKWEVIRLADSETAKMTAAALGTWDELAQQSPAAKEGVKLLKDFMRARGYIK